MSRHSTVKRYRTKKIPIGKLTGIDAENFLATAVATSERTIAEIAELPTDAIETALEYHKILVVQKGDVYEVVTGVLVYTVATIAVSNGQLAPNHLLEAIVAESMSSEEKLRFFRAEIYSVGLFSFAHAKQPCARASLAYASTTKKAHTNPSVSTLALLFDTSRARIYKWTSDIDAGATDTPKNNPGDESNLPHRNFDSEAQTHVNKHRNRNAENSQLGHRRRKRSRSGKGRK